MEAEAARHRRKGSEILPPDSASTGSSASLIPPPFPFPFPFRPLLNTFDPPKILPSRRKPEVKRRRVYFTLTSPAAFILDFSPAPRVSCTPSLAWSIASTLFPRSYRSHGVCIGVYGAVLLLPGTLTFLSCETRAFVRLLFASIVRMKV